MELKIVYRILRQVSDWTLTGFYSDVHVEGSENVPKHGPIILASTHHNEMIDIATLAATIPHRRHVSFWAKSSMFANPVFRWILVSSNTIPVRRNPDKLSASTDSSSTSLFKETCLALDEGRVIGVFPEGTSYTQPGIMQIKEGAGWAAAEYSQWQSSSKKHSASSSNGIQTSEDLYVIPVAIVYTDKSRYQSRVSVRYGKPMLLSDYRAAQATNNDADVASAKPIVKQLMRDIEQRLNEMAVISADWETLHASRIARDMLWGSPDNIPLEHFTRVSQTMVDAFSAESSSSTSLHRAIAPLIKYLALLQYTSITHDSLSVALPLRISAARSSADVSSNLSRFAAIRILVRTICMTVLHPHTLLSLPALIAHLPAFILSPLSVKLFSTLGEEETLAEFKAIFGGVGVGIGSGLLGWGAQRLIARGHLIDFLRLHLTFGVEQLAVVSGLDALQQALSGNQSFVKKWVVKLGLIYGVGWVLVRWHNHSIKANYRRWQLLLTSLKLFLSSWSRSDMPADVLELYKKPALPPVNPFLNLPPELSQRSDVPPPSMSQRLALVRHLPSARLKAYGSLLEVLQDSNNGLRDRLTAMGWKEVMMV
ncbi:hypothetical protein BDV98DRAFT_525392 [Pterulicium gracile]|uniref:Phospholipid/glycerol acyltransferase domain-containing protein n=1 Tax=Pterulicium gracile TaxID=1884261 RepID=A0A5C3QZI0_9AGAR|nr:hypothetical protein BDV98DRAFT_525392 [Pterula gracilis]